MKKYDRFIIDIGTLGRCGFCRIMPGTVGAFLGTIFSYIAFNLFRSSMLYIITFILVLFAIYVCSVAEKTIGTKDPSCVIFDEFIAMPICFLSVFERYNSIWLLTVGFVIFRIFDIFKPFGIKKLEKLNGGLGIVLDDVIAAIYTNISLQILVFVL